MDSTRNLSSHPDITVADTPLVWTKYGNLPAGTLRREVRWEDTPTYVKHVEVYYRGDEVVKESADVLSKVTLDEFLASSGHIGGIDLAGVRVGG